MPDGRRGILSTSAVLAPSGAGRGDLIHQPGQRDQSVLTGLSRIAELTLFPSSRKGNPSGCDYAVAVLIDPDDISGNVVPDGCPGAGMYLKPSPEAVRPGDDVAFLGAASGYREAVVTAVDMRNLRVDAGNRTTAIFDGVIEISAGSEPCSRPGDSGAMVWRRSDGSAIGMVFAAAVSTDGVHATYVIPLETSLAAAGVTWLTP
ncbi:MAG TPA: hypothetical protein VHB27_03670 [Rhodopila sp.]|uniref:hypothetical protein n=1 Tax=Rhodopila sp. TaxID=2480087 RepID=UPI002C057945|nr:hypothetical protein [Rhodopila sp.]HVY14300.1 hypothetical protein [Rhodopila sp.]